LSVLAAAGVATWALAERLARLRQQAQAQVRISGSRLAAAFTGNRFPITHSSAAREDQADPEIWRLSITGAVADPQRFTYAQLSGQELGEKEALLDCTLGWYTIQNWQGIQLRDLLELAGASDAAAGVNLVSVTGYSKYLPMQDALEVLLALKVGGEDLDHWHGYPVRAVVPSRRGWYWVKWLSEIEVVRLPEGVHVDLNERPST
jgi:DMSO/TMAO reductase YedYZ molybdopterin-dependent catalytic subunit